MQEPLLSLTNISWSAGDKSVLSEIDLKVHAGEFVGLIGPNGSGKSSLLRTIFRYLEADSGRIAFNGRDITTFSIRESAQQIATVLQERGSEFNLTVFDVVMMGRTPHKRIFEFDSDDDVRLAEKALAEVGLTALRTRSVASLSGGELQRTLLARALCQQSQLLLLDEPTNHLDIRYQLEIMQLIKRLGIASLAALHELNLAAMFCSRLYVLAAGKVVASGSPREVLTRELLSEVYGVCARVQQVDGRLNILFFPEEDEYREETTR